jgi:hypothetical protein
MATEINNLEDFLTYAAKGGYASEAVNSDWQADGSQTIELTHEDWDFHDNYFTSSDGRRFHGREVVYYEGRPIWFMAYSGFVDEEADPDEVFTFLREAMKQPRADFPIRGPEFLNKEDMAYTLGVEEGDLDRFIATESITSNEEVVYEAVFIGGKID